MLIHSVVSGKKVNFPAMQPAGGLRISRSSPHTKPPSERHQVVLLDGREIANVAVREISAEWGYSFTLGEHVRAG